MNSSRVPSSPPNSGKHSHLWTLVPAAASAQNTLLSILHLALQDSVQALLRKLFWTIHHTHLVCASCTSTELAQYPRLLFTEYLWYFTIILYYWFVSSIRSSFLEGKNSLAQCPAHGMYSINAITDNMGLKSLCYTKTCTHSWQH